MGHEIRATLLNGVFVPEQPTGLADGTRVELQIGAIQPPASKQAAAGRNDPPGQAPAHLVESVLDATARIFGGKVEMKYASDPEYPHEKNLVFVVYSRDPSELICQKEKQWLRETQEAAAQWPDFSLLIRVES